MNSNDKHSDNDLKAYLDGRDGVSAAYRKAARDEPPATLDAAILKAARAQGGVVVTAKPEKRRAYALAASVMLGVVAASLYFRLPEDGGSVATKLAQPSASTIEAAPLQNAGAQTPEPESPSPEGAAPQQDFQVRQLPPPAPTVGAESAVAPARDSEAATDTFARAAESAAMVIDGPLLERIEAEAAAAQTSQLAPGGLEEIQITGSRIRQRDAADVSYRESRDEWLTQMRILSIELERSSRLATANRNTAALAEELEDEMELFAVEYPDVDLDAELER